MAIKGFDYKKFAIMMAEQAKELAPPDLKDFEKEYIVKTLGDFTFKAGETLYKDETLNIDEAQAVFITQVIAEWTFHKSIDLIHSGILPQYWDSIMHKIAFTIFEIAKQAVIRKIPQEQLLKAVEQHVMKVYNQSIEELEEKGIIDEEVKNRAESQSNIDAMAKQVQADHQRRQEEIVAESVKNAREAQRRRDENASSQQGAPSGVMQGISNKEMKLMSLALLLKVLSQDKVTTILNKFSSDDSLIISQYMNMADLESRLDGDLVADCLQDMRKMLPTKKKLTQENVLSDLMAVYATNPREKVERVIRSERPLVKRFISQAYDGEFGEVPLRVAGIIAEYIEESV